SMDSAISTEVDSIKSATKSSTRKLSKVKGGGSTLDSAISTSVFSTLSTDMPADQKSSKLQDKSAHGSSIASTISAEAGSTLRSNKSSKRHGKSLAGSATR